MQASDAADDAIVLHQLDTRAARQHALRAVSDEHVRRRAVALLREREIGPRPRERFAHLLGRADGTRRFEHHEIALLEHGRDGQRRALHVTQVGRAVVLERRGHRDQEYRGRLRRTRHVQHLAFDRERHLLREPRLLDVDGSARHGIDHAGVDIDTEHAHGPLRGDGRRRQSDIAEPDHAGVVCRCFGVRHRIFRCIRNEIQSGHFCSP